MARLGLVIGSVLPASELTEVGKLAEKGGFESVWLTEAWGKDAFTQMAAVALGASKVLLATGIVPIYTRTPTLMAMTAAGIDEVSGGRLVLGLGTSHRSIMEDGHGVKLERPLRRMREYVDVVRGILASESFSYAGKEYSINGFRLAIRPARRKIPIYLAGLGLKMMELAGEIGDGVLMNLASPDYVREAVRHVRIGAERAGRNPDDVDIACFVATCLSGDRAAALRAGKRQVAFYSRMPFYANMLKASGFEKEVEAVDRARTEGRPEAAIEAVTDKMAESIFACGTPDQCRARLEVYRKAGVKLPVVSPLSVDKDLLSTLREAALAFSN